MAPFKRKDRNQNDGDSKQRSNQKNSPSADNYHYGKGKGASEQDPDSYVYGEKKVKKTKKPADQKMNRPPDAPGDQDSFVYGEKKSSTVSDPNLIKPAGGAKKAPGSRKSQQVFQDTSETDPDYWNKSLEQRYEENYPAERRILLRNIRRVAAVILAMFLALMSYLVYFQVTKAEDLRADSGNRRNAEARNRVLRGTIYDRSGEVLSESTLDDDGTQTRKYPGGAAFGNVLGYVSDKYSITGLEQSLDKTLSRDAGIESFFTLEFISSLFNPEQAVTRRQEGDSVRLTLDEDLQDYAYQALDGRRGSVVALDPGTGEILAMVSSPGFSAADLDEVMQRVNEDEKYAANAPLINRAIRSVYAPGSTMKAVTLASALEHIEGVEDRIFNDRGVIEFPDGSIIRNFNDNVYGEMDLQQSFTNSSNYVFGNLGIELTNSQLKKTAEQLGFNEEITMEGMTVRESVFPSLRESEQGNKALSALGQGEVAATPLQIALVSAVIANDGQMARPYIVAETLDKDGNPVQATEPKFTDSLDPAVAGKVKDLMQGNVRIGGSAYRSLSDIDGAGKTGTGQFEAAGGTRVNAWFTGFAPAEDPKIAIAVVLEDLEDINDNTGSRQALPIARDIMSRWLNR